jgi:hypothetical protein
LVKLRDDLIAVTTLDQPFMYTHEAQAEPPVLSSNVINLVIRELGLERSTNEEHGRKVYNVRKLLNGTDATKVDRTKVTHIAIVF